MFNDGWNAAKREGIIRGAYHFLIGGGATEQADNFVTTVGQLDPGDLPPVVVFDANPGGPSATVEDLVSWLEAVERRFGARPVIYSGNYLRTLVGASAPDKLLGYPIWLAQYGPTPVVPTGWSRWTFGSSRMAHSDPNRILSLASDDATFRGSTAHCRSLRP